MPFNFTSTSLEGVVLVEPHVFPDERGFFLESYKRSDFEAAGIGEPFVQDNHSFSSRGVLRGIHYQLPPAAQGKLVRVLTGGVLDVAVDLRKSSASFRSWISYELTSDNRRMLYIPPGFGHGFLALEDNTHLLYKCTEEYEKSCERGLRWDDPEINVEWPVGGDLLVSKKDGALPFLSEAELFQ